MDDLAAHSKTFDQHIVDLRSLFTKMRASNLKVKASKCQIFHESIDFLGYNISRTGVAISDAKISPIRDMPAPTNKHQVKSFLGIVSYYRNYVDKVTERSEPLRKLTLDTTKFEWSTEHQRAFEDLKHALTAAPILAHPQSELPYILHCDASKIGVGAVLCQIQDNREKVIAFQEAGQRTTEVDDYGERSIRSLLGYYHQISHILTWCKVLGVYRSLRSKVVTRCYERKSCAMDGRSAGIPIRDQVQARSRQRER